jgi:hypothetical protein
MINSETLKELLNLEDKKLKDYDLEQLRMMLGTYRYMVRRCEREINKRCEDAPLGNFFE